MALTLFYITNKAEIALIAERNGVDRIWIDLESLGKEERQRSIDSVKSHHTIDDIKTIKPLLTKSEMLVRVNPWNNASKEEIDEVVDAGADIIMLPMWKNTEDVERFLSAVGHRTKTTLLLETKEAVECIDKVLELDFDEIHIGLNDLHLSYGMTFMFELLSNGIVEFLCEKFKKRCIPYGFGGIARLGGGLLPAEKIIMEHYRIGSTRAILSRSFCDNASLESMDQFEKVFAENIKKLREFEDKVREMPQKKLLDNKESIIISVAEIVDKIERSRKDEC